MSPPDSASAQPTDRPLERHWFIVPAAGVGRRMGADVAKQYLRIRGRTLLELTLDKLLRVEEAEAIVVALHPEDSSWTFLSSLHCVRIETVAGGDERNQSVLNALRQLRGRAAPLDWVLVHDAVRPCVALEDIQRLMARLAGDPIGGLLAAPVRETVKRVRDGVVESTLDRSQLWLAATPQMFRYAVLLQALEQAQARGLAVTDEAAAVEAMGHPVRVVAGRADNIKITTPEDLVLVDFLLSHESEREPRG